MDSIPEHSFDEEDADMPKQAPVVESEESKKLRDEQMRDPKVQARIKQIFEDAKSGDTGPGITEEELPDFLREQRR